MSLPFFLGALTLAPALCALLIAGLGVARFAFKSLALALCLIGLLLPIVLLFILYPELSSGNPVFAGLFGGSSGLNDWFSAAYRIDGFGLYAAFGITIIVAPLLVWMAWRGMEGETADAGPEARLARQNAEHLHHGDRSTPPSTGVFQSNT